MVVSRFELLQRAEREDDGSQIESGTLPHRRGSTRVLHGYQLAQQTRIPTVNSSVARSFAESRFLACSILVIAIIDVFACTAKLLTNCAVLLT